MQRVRVGELAPADQRQPVDRALRALARLRDVRGCSARCARRARRSPSRIAAVARRATPRSCAMWNAWPLSRCTRTWCDARVLGERDLGHRVGEIGAVVQRDVVLDRPCSRAAASGDDQHARIARRVLLRGDEQQMHRRRRQRFARGTMISAPSCRNAVLSAANTSSRKSACRPRWRRDRLAMRAQRRPRGWRRRRRRRASTSTAPAHRRRRRRRAASPLRRDRKRLDVARPRAACRAHRLKRLSGERREVGEAPLLVARRRHGQRADALDRLGAQLRSATPAGSPAAPAGPRSRLSR